MKTPPRIDVWVNAQGDITIDAVGYTGSTCEEATAFLEETLGTVDRKQRTRDYYRPCANRQKNRQSNTDQQST